MYRFDDVLGIARVLLVVLLVATTSSATQTPPEAAAQGNENLSMRDISTDYTDEREHVVSLTAWPDIKNAEKATAKQWSSLRWSSLGIPRIVRREGQPFVVDNSVLKHAVIELSTLDEPMKKALAEQANRQYLSPDSPVRITPEQFTILRIDSIDAHVDVPTTDGLQSVKGTLLKGNKQILRLQFPYKTPQEFTAFKAALEAGAPIKGQIAFDGVTVKRNVLTLQSSQFKAIRLENKLFGDANKAYVSRTQLSNLAGTLFKEIRIAEEYEIPEERFKEEFVNSLVSRFSETQVFAPLSFDEFIDKYYARLVADTIDKDITADSIKKEASDILRVRTDGDKQHIVRNTSSSAGGETGSESLSKGSGGINILGIGGASGSGESFDKQSEKWNQQNTSLDDQLKELNSTSQDHVKWEIEGDRVVPKSIEVAVLSKQTFNEDITFSRIYRQVTVGHFMEPLVVDILDDLEPYSRPSVETQFRETIAALVPTGTIAPFAGSTAPPGWMMCDGKPIPNKAETEAIRGFLLRNGWCADVDNVTAPDFRGRFLVGQGSQESIDKLGESGGSLDHSHTYDDVIQHSHEVRGAQVSTNAAGAHTHAVNVHQWCKDNGGPSFAPAGEGEGNNEPRNTTTSAGAHSHTVDVPARVAEATGVPVGTTSKANPPYAVVNYIIKL